MKTLELVPATETGARDPYVAYSYSYPHKSAYGALDPPVPLEPLWQAEQRDALFLYVHLPFCEMRCGFCNLFAQAQADNDLVEAYLATLARQSRVMAEVLGEFAVARFALGGGTPTILQPGQLERLFDLLAHDFRIDFAALPTSVETSPKTATADKLAILQERGIERVSIGVQSFDERETDALGRPQQVREVHAALERLRGRFAKLNIDLIYGYPEQTSASWLASLRAALVYQPEEIFLYPLYIRARTGLGRRGRDERLPADRTRQLYRAGRDLLLAAGYEQISMRCFRARRAAQPAGPAYCCQSDGMVGLGCGARSYATRLHYSSRFAVEAAGVQAIIAEWIAQPADAFRHAHWGIRLSDEDCRRRYVIQSLLTRAGLQRSSYEVIFGESAETHFPELVAWQNEDLVEASLTHWQLTERGMEHSDHLGPALYSSACRAALERFVAP